MRARPRPVCSQGRCERLAELRVRHALLRKHAEKNRPESGVDQYAGELTRAVCDKLAQVADNTNDEKLMHEVEELKERVWAIYQQRTANLSNGPATVEPDEARGPAGRKSAKARRS